MDQYKAVQPDGIDNLEKFLNQTNSDGWNVRDIFCLGLVGGRPHFVVVFVRPSDWDLLQQV